MSRHRYLFLVVSSVVAIAVLWGVWRHLGTHLPCCDALDYGKFGASVRDVGLWGGFLRSDLRTFGFPLYLSLFGGELSPDTAWGCQGRSKIRPLGRSKSTPSQGEDSFLKGAVSGAGAKSGDAC